MTTAIEYALMAGSSYISNRATINRFPAPQGWAELTKLRKNDPNSGFEATTFQQGTDIVISYAGTDDNGKGVFSNADKQADLLLGLGLWSDQLGQAAAYYLGIKATINSGATISFTGHSLGGGLASLMSVFFGESAFTFDQAPFAACATQAMRSTLVNYLTNHGYTTQQLASLAPGLFTFIFDPAIGAQKVTDINVNGEFLSSTAPYNLLSRIGTQTNIPNTAVGVSGFDLHSQALLTAFLQSNQTAASGQALNDVTVKLTDLLKMIFDKKLFAYEANTANKTNPNFLELIVNHEAGRDPRMNATITPDTMVDRFTTDLWKIAQDGGLTLNNAALSRALTAFSMQKYYNETQASAGYNKTLFTGITGGIQFDIKDVASTPAAAKGYADFRLFLEQYYSTVTTDLTGATIVTVSPTKDQIIAALSSLRDWYIQAGVDAMTATDTLNRNAFMFGNAGSDILTGGNGNDLLVGNGGADTLTGGAGDDTLIGGAGNDTMDGGTGYDTYTLEGRDTIRDADGLGMLKDKAGNILSGIIQKNADGSYTYLNNPAVSVTLDAASTLTLTLANGAIAVVESFTPGNLGLYLADVATIPLTGDIVPTDFAPTAAGIQAQNDVAGNLIGTVQAFEDVIIGKATAEHIISGAMNDDVAGMAGNDWIEAGSGNDFVNGGVGNDQIEGGSGADILLGNIGNDLIYADAKIDIATAITNGNTDMATGLKGDWLAGNAGNDTLIAGASNDVLSGGGGNDTLIAGAGDDFILGDSDYTPQLMWESAPRFTPRFSINGIDWFHSNVTTFDWSVTQDASGTYVFAPTSSTSTTTPADGGADVIYAGDGADHVWAGAGNDIVMGEGGNDTLLGGIGANYIDGGIGNDFLQTDGDNGTLIGGAGDDTFVVDNASDVVIENLNEGTDTVQSSISYALTVLFEREKFEAANNAEGRMRA